MADVTARKKQILRAAGRLFRQLGFEHTSMKQIASEAGSGKASLYYYFKSKDELLAEILEHELKELTMNFNRVEMEEVDYRDKLFSFMAIPVEIFENHSCVLLKMLFERFSTHFIKPQKIMQEGKELFVGTFRKIICEGQQKGYIRQDLNVDLLEKVYLYNLINTLFMPAAGSDGSEEIGGKIRNYEFMIELMLHGILDKR